MASVIQCYDLRFIFSVVGSASEHGTRIHISPIESPLSGDVNITFWFPPGLSADGTERVVTVNVYYFAPAKRRVASVATRLANKTHLVVSIRCDYFDQQGRYQFGYRLSESGISGTINQTLFLRWSKLRIDSPRNHTALTKFGSIWIHHDRKCLPGKYRDKVYLYYTRGEERVTITSKVVRKLYNGRQKEDGLRVRFSCELFDTQGNYFFEYVSGAQDGRAVLARSKTMQVTWSKHSLSTPIKSIIPCNNTFTVTFTAPECRRTTDTVELYEQNSGKFIAEKLALPGHNTVFYPCTLFSDYVKGYCFKYVTKALFTKRKTIQATLCVPTLKPGESLMRLIVMRLANFPNRFGANCFKLLRRDRKQPTATKCFDFKEYFCVKFASL